MLKVRCVGISWHLAVIFQIETNRTAPHLTLLYLKCEISFLVSGYTLMETLFLIL